MVHIIFEFLKSGTEILGNDHDHDHDHDDHDDDDDDDDEKVVSRISQSHPQS